MHSVKYILILLAFLVPAFSVNAQTLHQDIQGVWRAEVSKIVSTENIIVPGTDVETTIQTIEALLLEGEREGETVTFENDYILLDEGDKFFLNYLVTIDGVEIYSVREVDRRATLFVLLGIFVAIILIFGKWQGLRSLVSLAGSLLVITYILVPKLVDGVSPIPLSITVAGLVLFFAIFFTHGFNRRSLVAYGGTIIAVAFTGLFAYLSVHASGLSGFSTHESIYLNLNTGGELDFVGLLLAAMIIGALGVLDDIAVTQVAVVRELFAVQSLSKWEVYKKAMRVGREHVGALVNTLVLAYAATALPLLLLFSLSESGPLSLINREIFATEIVRSLVGSTGLVLTVPITTLLAVLILEKYRHKDKDIEITHSHSH